MVHTYLVNFERNKSYKISEKMPFKVLRLEL